MLTYEMHMDDIFQQVCSVKFLFEKIQEFPTTDWLSYCNKIFEYSMATQML